MKQSKWRKLPVNVTIFSKKMFKVDVMIISNYGRSDSVDTKMMTIQLSMLMTMDLKPMCKLEKLLRSKCRQPRNNEY